MGWGPTLTLAGGNSDFTDPLDESRGRESRTRVDRTPGYVRSERKGFARFGGGLDPSRKQEGSGRGVESSGQTREQNFRQGGEHGEGFGPLRRGQRRYGRDPGFRQTLNRRL